MTAFNAKPHEVRAMLGCDEFCIVRPVSANLQTKFDAAEAIVKRFPNQRGLPFSHGDVVTVKEAHYLTDDGDEQFAVFTDDAEIVRKHLADIDRLETRWPWIDKEIIAGHRRLRSSAQMPAWASRLTLEILPNGVSVKRVQEIADEEILLSGLKTVTKDGSLWKWGMADRDGLPGTDNTGWPWHEWKVNASEAFARLWNQHHPKTPWSDNPWVCVARAKVHHCNIAKVTSEEPS